jgi:RNA polymerase sigma-70 factor (ECF subfamily)
MLENEKKYVEEARNGNGDSFGIIYNHYVPQIYRFVFFKVSKRQAAEDLTHEIFLSAWQNIKNYKQKEFPISSWLYQIARNRVIDYYRTDKKNISIDTEDFKEDLVGFYEQKNPDIALSIEEVKKLIKLLKPEYQDVIIMRYVEDMDSKEIASAMNKSEGAIRLIQHRAINNLKQLYAKHRGIN